MRPRPRLRPKTVQIGEKKYKSIFSIRESIKSINCVDINFYVLVSVSCSTQSRTQRFAKKQLARIECESACGTMRTLEPTRCAHPQTVRLSTNQCASLAACVRFALHKMLIRNNTRALKFHRSASKRRSSIGRLVVICQRSTEAPRARPATGFS